MTKQQRTIDFKLLISIVILLTARFFYVIDNKAIFVPEMVKNTVLATIISFLIAAAFFIIFSGKNTAKKTAGVVGLALAAMIISLGFGGLYDTGGSTFNTALEVSANSFVCDYGWLMPVAGIFPYIAAKRCDRKNGGKTFYSLIVLAIYSLACNAYPNVLVSNAVLLSLRCAAP